MRCRTPAGSPSPEPASPAPVPDSPYSDLIPPPPVSPAPGLANMSAPGGYGYGSPGDYGGYGANVTQSPAPGDDGANTTIVEAPPPAPEPEPGYVAQPSGPTEPLPETVPYSFSFQFLGVDFDTFVADPVRVAGFKLDVRRRWGRPDVGARGHTRVPSRPLPTPRTGRPRRPPAASPLPPNPGRALGPAAWPPPLPWTLPTSPSPTSPPAQWCAALLRPASRAGWARQLRLAL